MKPLRFAIFGAEFWARCQLAAWREVGGVECVAIYNRSRDKAEAFARDLGVPAVYDDAGKLLRELKPDFVDNITEVGAHKPLLLLCAKHRIPCICQKPMAASLKDARQMISAFAKAKTPFFVHENWRWQRPMRELINTLRSGVIGTPFRARLSFISGGGGTPAGIGVLVMLALGAGLGALKGAVITLLRLPSFIVTLASMMFLSGFAVWLTQSKNIYGLPASFLALGQRLPFAVVLTAALAVAAHLMLRRTVFGRWLYSVGQNATTAHISGVPVRAMTFAAYVASGFCAALASVMLTGRLETGSPVLGREILLDIIGATVVGGTSLFGGKGKIA
ncbi:MAG: hypothetical protein EXS36_01445 [Pedosphaera sp.]|nr:hypothetical protein [Pedosphaera sp.]